VFSAKAISVPALPRIEVSTL